MPENSRCPWVFMVVCGEGWGGCDSWWQREAPGLAYQPVLVQREGPGLKQQCAVRQQIRESGCWVYKAKIICYYGGKEWPALSTWLLGGMFPEDKPLVDQEFLWLPEDQDFILRFIYVYFYVCGCFACVCCVCCVSVLTAYMLGVWGSQERVLDSLGLELQTFVNHHGCWELNLSTLQEQPLLPPVPKTWLLWFFSQSRGEAI